MIYGVTPTGFVRPTFDEILEELRESARDDLGAVNTDPESAIGQQLAIMAERENRAWEVMEAVYLSQYPNSASGRSLDGAVQLTGVTRLSATRTIAQVVLFGVPGSVIESGAQASVVSSNEIFETVSLVTLQASNAIQALLSIDVQNEATYMITINGVGYSYVSSSNATNEEIANGLIGELPESIDGLIDESIDGLNLFIVAANRSTAFTLAVTSNLTIESVGSPAQMRAINFGRVLALAGTLTNIVTSVSGWQGLINYLDAPPGREREEDPDVRLRRENSLQITGSSTVEAIRSRILQGVQDVVGVIIIENRSDLVDVDGRPPHSYEVVVSGGTNEDLANIIWQTKPAGIETAGLIEESIVDSVGRTHTVRFSRPVDQYVWAKVAITLNGVGSWPDNGLAAVADNMVAYGKTLNVGDDIKKQALFGPIYQVPGISNAEILLAVSASPTIEPDIGEFVSENVVIGSNEISIWASERIEVSLV